jgi:hypothetical protein
MTAERKAAFSVHLIADELWTPRVSAPPATAGSRDFH